MSVDEINEAIRRDIYINAYEQQKKDPHKYKGRALAEDLETILYLCPKCHAIGKTHSHDNEFSCECGYKMHINEYGFLRATLLSLTMSSTGINGKKAMLRTISLCGTLSRKSP